MRPFLINQIYWLPRIELNATYLVHHHLYPRSHQTSSFHHYWMCPPLWLWLVIMVMIIMVVLISDCGFDYGCGFGD